MAVNAEGLERLDYVAATWKFVCEKTAAFYHKPVEPMFCMDRDRGYTAPRAVATAVTMDIAGCGARVFARANGYSREVARNRRQLAWGKHETAVRCVIKIIEESGYEVRRSQ